MLRRTQPAATSTHQGVGAQIRSIGAVFGRRELRPLLLLLLLVTLIMALFVTTIGLFLQLRVGAPVAEAGLPPTIFGILNIVFQLALLPRLVRRYGERALIPVGFVALALANLGLFFASSLLTTTALAVFLALGITLLRPSLTALITRVTPPGEVGRVLGVTTSLDSLAEIIAPLLGGALIEVFNPAAPGLLAAAIAAVALLLFGNVRQRIPARATAAVPEGAGA